MIYLYSFIINQWIIIGPWYCDRVISMVYDHEASWDGGPNLIRDDATMDNELACPMAIVQQLTGITKWTQVWICKCPEPTYPGSLPYLSFVDSGQSTVRAESVVVNPRTLELLVGLIRKASKGPTCPDIENEDLSSISSTYRADFTNPESRPLLSNGGW